jgi:hypothetical protein
MRVEAFGFERLRVCLFTISAVVLVACAAAADGREKSERAEVGRVLARFGTRTPERVLEIVRADRVTNEWYGQRPAHWAERMPEFIREHRLGEGRELEKLRGVVAPVLALHGKAGLIEPVLFRSDRMYVGLVAGWGLAVSTRSLALLTPVELRAAAAHELGHIYTMGEAVIAERARDDSALRELELFSDGVAAATLLLLGEDPRAVVRGVEREAARLSALGVAAPAPSHPSLGARKELNARLIAALVANRQLTAARESEAGANAQAAAAGQ